MLLVCALAVAAPRFSVERGLLETPFELGIEATEGGEIELVVGPDGPWQSYPGPLWIEGTTVVRAVEVVDGERSEEEVHSYLFIDQVVLGLDPQVVESDGEAIHATLRELPSVSILSDEALSLDEQMVSVEWLDPQGEDLQVFSGARKVGGHSLNYAKNNLRLNFRSIYGTGRWEADLFEGFESGLEPADKHDALTLRSGSHDSLFYLAERGQYLRNRWMDESQLAMGHIAPHGRYVHVYTNLEYIGLYHLRERFGAGLLSEMLGGEEEDYEAVNSGQVVDGVGGSWMAVVAAYGEFEALDQHLDSQNFVDYMLLNFYAGNAWDWYPEQNWMAAGPAEAGSGWLFHSSDSDICLVYGWDVNILHLQGPSWLFQGLVQEAHPDFMVLLADRIHALLEGSGPLTAEMAMARYEGLSLMIEDAVVAESARWGGGWWTRDHWEIERAYLLNQWFPYRSEELLRQLREVGWYPVEAPVFSRTGGPAELAESIAVSLPADLPWGGVVLTVDGSDPRLPGGEIAATATGPVEEIQVVLDGTRHLSARVLLGDRWGPLHTETYTVGGPSLLLNEWNAVEPDERLAEGDTALGQVLGNGGDWLELLLLEDLDLSGWRLVMRDRSGPSELVFGDDPALSLSAGTLLTIADEMPEDLAYSPEDGDWRLHLSTGGSLIQGELDVTHRDWTLEVLDRSGRVRLERVGEGLSLEGLGSDEVGILAAQPLAEPLYRASESSTFGAANLWPGGVQDLSGLRVPPPPRAAESRSCGPSTPVVSLLTLLLAVVGCRREEACYADRDEDGWGGEPVTCESSRPYLLPDLHVHASVSRGGDCDDEDPWVNPGAPEVCGGGDEDCDGLVDDEDPDLADPLPFFEDADGDGFGGPVEGACELSDGLSTVGGDCDDAAPEIYPGAFEECDGDVDADCDGVIGAASGQSESCPARSCLHALEEGMEEDGPVWLELHGGSAPVWCDMSRGGWTLGFLRNSASYASQPDFGSGEQQVGVLALSPQVASVLTEGILGWLDLNAFDYTELRLAGYTDGVETALTANIPRSELRIAFGQPGYLLYGPDHYWCGGPASYTDAGVGAVNNPQGAPADCKGHGSLGSGWDFSASPYANRGLSLCGGDAFAAMQATIGGGWFYYGSAGASQAIWVR